MALIPGASVNGKFKTFQEMTIEELEQVVIQSQIKKMVVVLLSVIFVSLAILVSKF